MKGRNGPLLVILMFGLALGAGIIAGKMGSRVHAGTAVPQRETLSDELELTATQRAQMQKIWEAVSATSHQCLDEAHKVQHDQDAALMNILTPEQQAEYRRLSDESVGKIAVIDARRKAAFTDAVQRTLPILNERQQQMYQQMIADRGLLPDLGKQSVERP